jgi:RimJ/RimL family protein N-acetyltransferase
MRQTSHTPVLMPVTRFDRGRLAGAFERMSRESRYQRFLHPKPTLSDAELTYFTDIDHRTHDAIAAVDPDDGSFVGVARYAVLDERVMSADLAFFVIDEWQGRGVATTLMRTLLPRAEANGINSLIALTLHDNAPARALLRNLGFRKVGSSHGVAELSLSLHSPIALAA